MKNPHFLATKHLPQLLIILALAFILLLGFYYVRKTFFSGTCVEIKGARFKHMIVDIYPSNIWGKAVGDINEDGLVDIIVGENKRRPGLYEKILQKLHILSPEKLPGELIWYKNPTWEKYTISNGHHFSTDHEVIDVDRDGRNDVVSLTDTRLVWFRNPDWSYTVIDNRVLHDIEVADFDDDGDIDIVARNQSGFNHNDGNQLHFYKQESPFRWMHFAISVPHGEGMQVADMDGDRKLDVIVNDYWYKNPGLLEKTKPWSRQAYSPTWEWPDVFIDIADINMDGNPDVVLAPSEVQGKRYRIAWFEAPAAEGSDWHEHIIDPDVEAVHHFIAARDLDNDDDIDIVTAEMHQGDDPDEIAVYWNQSAGLQWKKEVVATTGSHSMQVVDIDNDGDIDFFGANWAGENKAVELWVNQTCPTTLNRWKRHVIDADKQWRSVFIIAADMDQDGYKDVVTGAWWYRNPGHLPGSWYRHLIGEPANNVAIVRDFDADGDLDILASQWKVPKKWTLYERILKKLHIRHYPPNDGFVWASNDGKGRFEIINNVASGEGDFLQGAVAASFEGIDEIALSWHKPGHGVQMLRVPDDPVRSSWTWRRISTISQDEALSAGDIDGDGDQDLVLGTLWLRNEGNDKWVPFILYPGDQNPDRNKLVDMNGDGRLDLVVGYEAISVTGKIAWYEQGIDPTQPWTEHLIATAIGPMSLDITDLEKDGDPDVIVGEHNLEKPEASRLLVYENIDGTALRWREHVIHEGDEHHNGTQVVDIDNDGDEDIISIGWGHNRVLLYENQNLSGQCLSISQ